MTKPLLLTVLLASVAAATGCAGYTTDSLHPADVRTVAVPVFQSSEFRRGLEVELTRELVRMIELRTPYKVTQKETADTILTGTVVDLKETAVSRDDDDNVIESDATLYVTYEWKDLRTGTKRSGRPLHYAWHFAASEQQTLRSAQTTAIRKLAEMIVEDMEKNW